MTGQVLYCIAIITHIIVIAQGKENLFNDIKIQVQNSDQEIVKICPARGRANFQDPDFGVEENLSFDGCGIWSPEQMNKTSTPPWFIVAKLNDRDLYCFGYLISEKAAILFECNEIIIYFENNANLSKIQIFGGESCQEIEQQDCNRFGLQLLNDAKAKGVTPLKSHLNDKRFWLMTMTNLSLNGNNLLPLCLYNGHVIPDDFYVLNIFRQYDFSIRNMTLLKPEDCCINKLSVGIDELIQYWGDHFEELMCTSDNPWGHLLINRKNYNGTTRHFLTGIWRFKMLDGEKHLDTYADARGWLEEVVNLTPDLSLFPKIPPAKPRLFESGYESFPGCGKVQKELNVATRMKKYRSTELQAKPIGLVFGGEGSRRGELPWHASLTQHGKLGILHDACGGTLISKTAIVTAAHCLYEDVNGKKVPLEAKQVEVNLGKYDAEDTKEPRQSFLAKDILVHPDYNPHNFYYENDIALLLFDSNETNFNELVHPACLWDDDYSIENITDQLGEVAGFGLTEERQRSHQLKKVEVEIPSHQACFLQNKKFFGKNLKPTMNFCAGKPPVAANCVGDSGGGLTIYKKGKHYLRGITSSALPKKIEVASMEFTVVCNPDFYSLYTDVTNYLEWIVDNVPDIEKKTATNF
ncbi:uncharacterized protein LOC132192438 [Neocloeon triangulifer]|uniref:uncharacterized protein LOC132192438 n=1 Tax=Neocloeon triangulifer TaxID=2078957 RepID=UPI00286F4C2D|nr:uncharacterized protein LOC132192438 [Neocloeon triangulifer]